MFGRGLLTLSSLNRRLAIRIEKRIAAPDLPSIQVGGDFDEIESNVGVKARAGGALAGPGDIAGADINLANPVPRLSAAFQSP